jgi:heptaprenyl diphosphate synthase
VAISPLLTLPGMDADRERVETAMRQAVRTSDDYLTEIASHLISAGGKRLRPVLTMVAARSADPEGSTAGVADEVVQGGISCELVHLGSLYHDDVMDEAPTRRGVETVNAKWGNLQAILAGDFLLARASEIAASLGNEVAGLLARTIARLCEGQIEELRHTYNVARPVDAYFASINGKTASLFSAAARIGALVAGHDDRHVAALTAYGDAYGMVFQVVDDLLDITSSDEALGKPAGHDMVEGVYTLPVLLTLAAGGTAASELTGILGRPLEGGERDKVLDIVRSNGGVRAAVERAGRFVDVAREACRELPGGDVADAMAEAPAALLAGVAD